MKDAEERQHHNLHGYAEVHDDHGRRDLTGELRHGRQIQAIVDRPHERYQRRADQHAMPQLAVRTRAGGQPHEHRHEHAGEDRQPTQQRRGAPRQSPFARLVDSAHGERQPHRERGEQRGDHGSRQEGVERVELGGMSHR